MKLPEILWSRRQLFRTAWAGALARTAAFADVTTTFAEPPQDAKMILYYWWFGPSQTEAQVIRELDAMRDAEIGGVFIFPVYPLSASDDVNYPYLSEKFLRVLDSTVRHAQKLSMGVDLLLGVGWPFGGPMISLDKSSRTHPPRAARRNVGRRRKDRDNR